VQRLYRHYLRDKQNRIPCGIRQRLLLGHDSQEESVCVTGRQSRSFSSTPMAHFIQYTGPQPQTVQPHAIHISGSVAPQDTTRQPIVHHHHYQQQQHPQASASTHASVSASGSGVLAQGDWTKDLVQLAKTAELKYALSFIAGLCGSMRSR